MDASRQVLRFSIPGSLLLLLTAGLIIGVRLLQGEPLVNIGDALRENVAPIVAILASIPVGFVVYQVYHLGVGPIVRLRFTPFDRKWVRVDRGQEILSRLRDDERDNVCRLFRTEIEWVSAHAKSKHPLGKLVKALELTEDFVRKGKAQAEAEAKTHAEAEGEPEATVKDTPTSLYVRRWYRNWDAVRTLIEICSTAPGASSIKSEYINLSDIYHALGACRTACALSGFASILTAIAFFVWGGAPLRGTVEALILIPLPAVALYALCHGARRQTWRSAQKSVTNGISWVLTAYPEVLTAGTPGVTWNQLTMLDDLKAEESAASSIPPGVRQRRSSTPHGMIKDHEKLDST
jgi:hypothetical protein